MDLYADVQRQRGFSFWAVRLRGTDRLIGDCGLAPLEWRGPEIEIGFRLAPACWDRGLASEAAAACLEAGFLKVGLERIIGRARPENAASRRVMEKIGMLYEGPGFHEGRESVVYGLSRDDWLRRDFPGGIVTGF